MPKSLSPPTGLHGYETFPWNFPVPVSRADFVPLFSRHRPLNVRVDLPGIGVYDYSSRWFSRRSHLMYCDFQTNPDFNNSSRLGSGRSGFFGGKYLKGVGRTPLAANWPNPGDFFHNSGHLMTSAAIREYVVTEYIRLRGAGDSINGCEGLLIGPLAPALGKFNRGMRNADGERARLGRADLRFQAITVKPAEFVRISNLVWLLSRPATGVLADFFRLLWDGIHPGCRRDRSNATPMELARAFAAAVETGLDNFERYFKLGVYWGTFGNNFTLDGRFLDLEIPLIFGRPFFGVERIRRREPEFEVLGFESYYYLTQVRAFLRYLQVQLPYLRDLPGCASEGEAQFASEFLSSLGAVFGAGHVMRSKAAFEKRMLKMISGALQLSPHQRSWLKRLIGNLSFEHSQSRFCGTHLRHSKLKPVQAGLVANAETHNSPQLFSFTEAGTNVRAYFEAKEVRHLIEELEGKSDLDELLDQLSEVPRRLRDIFGSTQLYGG